MVRLLAWCLLVFRLMWCYLVQLCDIGFKRRLKEKHMKGSDLVRIVDQMHHEKNIDRNIIFDGIEAALQLAASEKKYRRGSPS